MPQPHILLAILDWGLGHATRCMPIISSLQQQGAKVSVACNKPIKNILQQEFPQLHFFSLPNYNISYSKHKNFLWLKLLWQLPRIIYVVNQENKWLKKIQQTNHFDAFISDNRFGFYHKQLPSIYITHQLHIETGNKLLNRLANKIHRYFINKYDACWVPDVAAKNNLAGRLSQPNILPNPPIQYLGIYSRFKKIAVNKDIDVLLLLSGPEPQRTLLENKLLTQIPHLSAKKIIMVRGLPLGLPLNNPLKDRLEIYNHVPANILSEYLQRAKQIVCRSGYSTLLDLVSLHTSAKLIPTPGQPEQRYLAQYLQHKNGFSYQTQQDFNLPNWLAATPQNPANNLIIANDRLAEVINDFLIHLKQ